MLLLGPDLTVAFSLLRRPLGVSALAFPRQSPWISAQQLVLVRQAAPAPQCFSLTSTVRSQDSDNSAEEGHSQTFGEGEQLDSKSCWSSAEGGLPGVRSEYETVIIFALGSTSYAAHKSLCSIKGMARTTRTEKSQETQSKVPILFVWNSVLEKNKNT